MSSNKNQKLWLFHPSFNSALPTDYWLHEGIPAAVDLFASRSILILIHTPVSMHDVNLCMMLDSHHPWNTTPDQFTGR